MKLIVYLKDKVLVSVLFLISYLLILSLLLAFDSKLSLIIVITFILFLFFFLLVFLDFIKRYKFYKSFLTQLEQLEPKYLITELISSPSFYEGEILYETLYAVNKSMIEKIHDIETSLDDFKEYVELWIHEIKIPFSNLSLHLYQQKKNSKIREQLHLLENYMEQILYYVRSEHSEKDYLIKKCFLDDVVHDVALKNQDLFLSHKITLEIKKLNIQVLSDSKWLSFMINQIVSNSLKYSNKKDAYILIEAVEEEKTIKLKIKDNGIGIQKQDLSRVFYKSFTGANGRTNYQSTGMGLYICKKLCHKLGHIIDITSEVEEFTCVTITFFKHDFYDVL